MDEKKIYKKHTGTGRSFKSFWNDAIEAERRKNGRETSPHQIELYTCRCHSVWCEACAPTCPTNARIREALLEFDWHQVRQIVLTVRRDRLPQDTWERVHTAKAIPQLMTDLNLRKWIWVLEWHRGGFPHWHVFTESPWMVGKRKIQRLWRYGVVWEDYIKDADHWKAMIGYHWKRGYFQGQGKAHQLVLPDWLMSKNRVRKYGRSLKLRLRRPDTEDHAKTIPSERPKRKTYSYLERLSRCDTLTKIKIDQERWTEIPLSFDQAHEFFEQVLGKVDYKTYELDHNEYLLLVDYLSKVSD